MHNVRCNYCDRPATLARGNALYRHRADLRYQLFWRCDPCGAHVGCHKAGAWTDMPDGRRVVSDGTLPLGRLANAELRRAKQAAHEAFDPLWKSRLMGRREAYAWLASKLGISVANCHIGMLDVDGCRAVVAVVREFHDQALQQHRSRRAA
jgi:hypothetical protein